MKKSIITLFALIVTIICSAQNITGNWNWQHNNGEHTTEIKLSYSQNGIQGNYCSVFYNGGKIDCVEEESSYCLILSQISTYVYEGSFQSFSHNGSGILRLTYNPAEDSLHMEILSSQGVFYLPSQAIFVR